VQKNNNKIIAALRIIARQIEKINELCIEAMTMIYMKSNWKEILSISLKKISL